MGALGRKSISAPLLNAAREAAWVGTTLRIVGFAALAALGAQVRIPVPGSPVPMTLQMLAVLLCGYALGARAATASMALYMAAGVVGLGVFAPGSAGLAGVTGGYLCGFLVGAPVLAVMRGGSSSVVRLALAGAVAVTVVLVCGVLWQTAWLGWDARDALGLGLWPFLPKATIELGLAVALVCVMNGRRRRRPSPAGVQERR